jgi:hypothetical protein
VLAIGKMNKIMLTETWRVVALCLLHEAVQEVQFAQNALVKLSTRLKQRLIQLIPQRLNIFGHGSQVIEHLSNGHGCCMDGSHGESKLLEGLSVISLDVPRIGLLQHPLHHVVWLIIFPLALHSLPLLYDGDEELSGVFPARIYLFNFREESIYKRSPDRSPRLNCSLSCKHVQGIVDRNLNPRFVAAMIRTDKNATGHHGDNAKKPWAWFYECPILGLRKLCIDTIFHLVINYAG